MKITIFIPTFKERTFIKGEDGVKSISFGLEFKHVLVVYDNGKIEEYVGFSFMVQDFSSVKKH